jgi:hypothetical protein
MLRLAAGIELVEVINEVQEVARFHGYVVTIIGSGAPPGQSHEHQ